MACGLFALLPSLKVPRFCICAEALFLVKSEGDSVLFEAKKYQKASRGKGEVRGSSPIDTFMENFSEVYLLSVILST